MKPRINLPLSPAVYARLEAYHARTKVPKSAVTEMALTAYLDRESLREEGRRALSRGTIVDIKAALAALVGGVE